MFARIYLILHGGPRVKIDVALKRLGLLYLTVQEDLPDNSNAKLRVICNNPSAAHGRLDAFYAGKKYVDSWATTSTGRESTSLVQRTKSSTRSRVLRRSRTLARVWLVSRSARVRALPLRLHQGQARHRARRLLQQLAGSRRDSARSPTASGRTFLPGELTARAGGPASATPPPPPPPPPPSGTSAGTVLVNGKAFTGGTIPYSSRANVTDGTLTLTTDTGRLTVSGAGVSAKFVLQRRTDKGRPIVQLRLVGGNFSVCPKTKRKSSWVAKAKPQKPVRRLYETSGSRGRVRIVGRYAAGTDQGTFWLTWTAATARSHRSDRARFPSAIS